MELKPASGPGRKSKSDRYREELERQVKGMLEPGEELAGIATASQRKGMLSSAVVALAVTDRRLIVQPLDRRGRGFKGEARAVTADRIEKVKAGGGGGIGDSPSAMIMDGSTLDLRVWTTEGEKLRFSLMHGEGLSGLIGGGAHQRNGVEALMSFLGQGGGSRI